MLRVTVLTAFGDLDLILFSVLAASKDTTALRSRKCPSFLHRSGLHIVASYVVVTRIIVSRIAPSIQSRGDKAPR